MQLSQQSLLVDADDDHAYDGHADNDDDDDDDDDDDPDDDHDADGDDDDDHDHDDVGGMMILIWDASHPLLCKEQRGP